MEAPKAPQLTAYDFLGYIVPGLAFVFLFDVSYRYHELSEAISYKSICAHYSTLSWPSLIPVLLLAYFLGHLISFASSISIEKHAMWMYGAPAKVLLYGSGAAYLNVNSSSNHFASKVMRIIIFMLLLPISCIEIALGKWLRLSSNYIRPVDGLIKTAFSRAMVRLLHSLGVNREDLTAGGPWEYQFENLAIHCALERAPAHVFTLRNYVVLFGFLRSMCLIMVGLFWCVVFHFIRQGDYCAASEAFIIGSIPVFLCYAGFLKFLFRYNHEAIMAIIASTPVTADS